MPDSLSIEFSKTIMTTISGSLLSTDIGGRLFEDEAPEDGAEYPYAIYFVVVSNPDDNFTHIIEGSLIQFSLFSTSKSSSEIKTMETHLNALFHKKMLTVAGQTMVWMERKNKITMVDDVITPDGTQRIKHYALDYEVTAQE